MGFLACQKYSSSSNSSTPGSIIPPDVMVTANVEGRVVDQDGTPVQGAPKQAVQPLLPRM